MEHNFDLSTICMQIFKGVEHVTTLFVVPLFLVRTAFAQAMGDGEEIKNSVKGVIIYFVLVASFPSIMAVILEIPNSFFTETIIPSVQRSFGKAVDNNQDVYSKAAFGSSPLTIVFLMETLSAVLFWIVWTLQVLISIFLTAIAPVVFLLTCLLGIGISNKLFFGLLVMTSTWPLAWYGFDQALHYLFQIVENSFGRSCIELVTLLFKGVVPILTAYLGINSGPGRMILGGMGKLTGTGKGAWSKQPNRGPLSFSSVKSAGFVGSNGGIARGVVGSAFGGMRNVQNDLSTGKIGSTGFNQKTALDNAFRSRAESISKTREPQKEVNSYTFDTSANSEFVSAAKENNSKAVASLDSESRTMGVTSRHEVVSHERAQTQSGHGKKQNPNQPVPAQSLYKNEVWAISCEYASKGYTNVKSEDYSGWSSEQLVALDKKWNPNGYSGPSSRQSLRGQSFQKQNQWQNSNKIE